MGNYLEEVLNPKKKQQQKMWRIGQLDKLQKTQIVWIRIQIFSLIFPPKKF